MFEEISLFVLLNYCTWFAKQAVFRQKNVLILAKVHISEAVARRRSVKKTFLEIQQNSQENICARVSFLLRFQASPWRWEHLFLAPFRMRGGGRGGGKKSPPTSFSPATSRKVETSPQNFLTFSFDLFATLV